MRYCLPYILRAPADGACARPTPEEPGTLPRCPRSDALGLEWTPTLGAPVSDREERRLLHFHPAPDLLELLLALRRLGLGDLLLHVFGRTVHEILGLLEPETGQLTHHLDHLDLLLARRSENDVEFRLLLDRRGRAAARRRRGHRHRRRRRHAPLLLQHLRELGCLEQGQRI